MIVDCHTHVSFPCTEADTAEHLEACEPIDACIVLPVSKDGADSANQQLSEYIRKFDKMIGFALIDPLESRIRSKQLRNTTEELGLSGAVVYCASHHFHPTHTRAMHFYEAAEEMQLPVFFSNSARFNREAILDYSQPYLLDEIARTFPHLKIIIGSMGRPFFDQTICMLGKHEYVYADLAISPRKPWELYNMVVGAHESGVMDKLLFGSGYPFATAGACIETLLGFNKLFADHMLRTVPREKLRSIIERDTLKLLGIRAKVVPTQ